MNRSTTVQSERGTAQRNVQRNWDRSSGKGTYSSETTGPGGKTVTRQGTVEKTGEGSYHQTGTITGPQGHTTDVDRTSTRNDDGSRTVNTTYTNEKGETKTVDKTITKTEDGRSMTGSYQTSTGKSGTIESKTTAEQLKLKAERDLERIRIESEQKMTQARAEAEALRVQKENVTENLIKLRQIEMQQRAIEKWDGKLPQVTGGATPFIDLRNSQ